MAGWPWPLNGVQGWFEGLWSEISRAASAAISPVLNWIWSGVTWVKDRILEGVSGLWTSIVSAFEGAKTAILGWVRSAQDAIGSDLNSLGSSLRTMITGGLNALGSSLSSLGSSLSSALDQARGRIESGLSGVQTSLTAAVSGATNSLATMFNGAMATVGSWVSDALKGAAEAMGKGLTAFWDWLSPKLAWLSAQIVGAATMVQAAVAPFFEMMGRGMVSQVTTIFSPGSPDTIMLAEAETAFKTMFEELQALTHIKKESLPPYEAIVSAAASILGRFLLLKLAVEGAAAAIDAAHPIKGLKAHEIAAGIMGILDMPSVIGPLLQEPIRQGIMIPWGQYWAQRYTPQIPGPGDLIRFVVREVLTPDEFYGAMPLHGYGERWARAYWDAHWVLPAFGNLVDAFHRGIITEGDLTKFLVWHDYSPTARPGVSKTDLEIMRGLIKTPIGRVDLRRGYELGRISFEDMVTRFEWLGYEEDSRLIAEIQAREALAEEIGKLRDNAKADFVKGYIDENEIRTALKELDYGDDIIEYHVRDAVQDRRRAYLDDMVAYLKDAYIKNYITTEEELEAELSKIIKIPDVVALEVDRAYIQKKGKVKEVAPAA